MGGIFYGARASPSTQLSTLLGQCSATRKVTNQQDLRMKLIVACFLLVASLAAHAEKEDPSAAAFMRAASELDTSQFTDFSSLLAGRRGDWRSIIKSRPGAFHALRSEPRVSYTLHIPKGFFDEPDEYKLLVAVHGSARTAEKYRDAFAAFADQQKFVVLAPLFPIGIYGNGFADGYKILKEQETRYDKLLLDMVADLNETCSCNLGKFYLFGFSGGGQFAQRFLYLHPEKVAAASIGAPGLATKIDERRPWFFGTANMDKKLGAAINLEELRKVPIQIIVGDKDIKKFEIPEKFQAVASKLLGRYGSNRLENMKTLQENYLQHGLDSKLEIVEGVGHEGTKMAPHVESFFLDIRLGADS
jgi:pimeloyl-ACP methyl ester carboxylesterase